MTVVLQFKRNGTTPHISIYLHLNILVCLRPMHG